jgi:hypothetical protein
MGSRSMMEGHTMATMHHPTEATSAAGRDRLTLEISNEPQWIVWPDADEEAAWADDELKRELASAQALLPARLR